ncbi:cache domain-containing protein [uncultured Neptuniibacter sp.]|uniref:cache domain-containing protein n=1 Tax=uncultured Neptuniibacter sp. TaxID=502143 RepID=UPI002615DB58|nr:cache domain-containing protein [uncultured Neptuniibacter sp.]
MRLSISKTLALGIVALQIVTVCVILISSYISTEQVLIGHAQKLMRNLSREVIHRSEEFLSPARSAVSLTRSLARNQVVSAEKPDEMEQYFFDQLRLSPHIAGIYYGNLEGDFYFVRRSMEVADFQVKRIKEDLGKRTVFNRWYDTEHVLVESSYDPTDKYDPRTRPWFTKAIGERKQIWTDPYLFFTSKTPGITVASPVFSQQGELIGVVGVDIDLSALSDFLGYLELSQHASALILNNNGDVIAHRNPQGSYAEDRETGARRLLRVDELKSPEARAAVDSLDKSPGWYVLNRALNTSFSYQENSYQAVFTPFSDNWPWILGIYVPEDDFLDEIKGNRQLNLFLAAGITLISLIVGVMFARSLSRPIQALQQSVEAVKKGEYEVHIESGNSIFHDIDDTTSAFRSMVEFLKENQQKSERFKKRLTQQAHFMEAVLANIESGVLVCDVDGKFVYSNRVVNRLRGLPDDAHLERFDDAPFRLFSAGGERELERDEWPIYRALAGENITGLEIIIVAALGEHRKVLVNAHPLIDTHGEKLGAYVSMRQVTDA